MSESDYTVFTKAMKHTHKILVPMMIEPHFSLLCETLRGEGYDIELLKTSHSSIVDTGLHYTHNDMCYPAILVVGQFIEALKSGKYDVQKTAVLITQTGGGCRASNYYYLLKKALKAAGFEKVPVISLSTKILRKESGFKLSKLAMIRCMYSIIYGDFLYCIYNQARSYEVHKGESDRALQQCVDYLISIMKKRKFFSTHQNYSYMISVFNRILLSQEKKPRVGIVGEIYIKYASLGNNDLEKFLISEGAEPVLAGLLDFLLYCIKNTINDKNLYNIKKKIAFVSSFLLKWLTRLQSEMGLFIKENSSFIPPDTFCELESNIEGIIGKGVKMGEGWLLTGEMVTHIQHGVKNIVCAQPFGCLPNHIVAKGVMCKIREVHPNANIVAIDYDPSASRINQENRLKLMLMNAKTTRNSIKKPLHTKTKPLAEDSNIKEECLCS